MSHSTSQLYHELHIDKNKEKEKSLGRAIKGSGLGVKLVETIWNTIVVLVPIFYGEKEKCKVELVL